MSLRSRYHPAKIIKLFSCIVSSQIVSSLTMARRKKAGYAAATQTLGEWLRQMRDEKGVPLRAVAAAADMDQAHLSKIELGQRVPTQEQTAKLAKFFAVNETDTQARRI